MGADAGTPGVPVFDHTRVYTIPFEDPES